MKRKITAVLAILLLAMSAQVFADKLVFTEFGVSYGKVFSPSHIPNSSVRAVRHGNIRRKGRSGSL